MSDYPFNNWNDFYAVLKNNLMNYDLPKSTTPIFDEKWEKTSYKGNLVIECLTNLLNRKHSSNDGLLLMIKLLLNHNSNNYKEYNYLLRSLETNLSMDNKNDYTKTIQKILELFFDNYADIDLSLILDQVYEAKDIYFKDNDIASHNLYEEFLSYELRGLILDTLISYMIKQGNIDELKNILNKYVNWKDLKTLETDDDDDLDAEFNDMSELNNKDQFNNIRYMVLKYYSKKLQEIYK
jgi:hypothetical protein